MRLNPEEWRYWVVAFEGSNAELQDLQSACSLIQDDIELGFHCLTGGFLAGQGLGWHQPSLLAFFSNPDFDHPVLRTIRGKDLFEIASTYKRIKTLDGSHTHVPRALRRFDDLRSLPRDSELGVIGLFSILESLVTHAPGPAGFEDSLGRQISKKMPLLRKRFARESVHSNLFGGILEEALWKILYEYRSKIVHGEDAALDKGLKVLGDRRKVIGYLKETVKLLLLLSLTEPVLMTDLKQC